ncbi:ABA-1 allergen, partial [Aphelenchoides avenae]
QRSHGEYTSFEDFVHRRLIWLTDKQKEELKNITVEYFDKMEAKINEFVDALKMQTQKEIAKEYTRLFGGLEDYLKTYLCWLTDEQKEQIRALKAEGRTKEELQAKIREFYDAATGETKEMATELLKDACRRKKVEEYGDSCKKIFGMGSSRSRHERHFGSGED